MEIALLQTEDVLMLKLTAEQVILIQNALNGDKRKEVVLKVENGQIVVLLVQKRRIA